MGTLAKSVQKIGQGNAPSIIMTRKLSLTKRDDLRAEETSWRILHTEGTDKYYLNFIIALFLLLLMRATNEVDYDQFR